jgi:hypothetical protein
MIGSLIDNLFLSALVKRIMKHGPDWDWFVELQRAKLRNYEEYTVTSTVRQPRDTSTYVPSVHHGNYLHSELEDRERRRSEVEFRTTVAIVLIFPTAMLVKEGGPLWLLTYVPGILVMFERFLLQGRTNTYMRNHLSVQIEELKSRLTTSDSGQIATPVTDGLQRDEPQWAEAAKARAARAESQLADLQKLEEKLGSRGFWRKARKDPTVQALKDSSLRIYKLRGGQY